MHANLVMSMPPSPSSAILSLSPFASTSTTRLYALYSDISRQKRSNPTSYHANVGWWRHTLESVVNSGAQHTRDMANTSGRLVLHAGRSLMDSLKVEGVGKPLGLGVVIVRGLFLANSPPADCHLVLARMNSVLPTP